MSDMSNHMATISHHGNDNSKHGNSFDDHSNNIATGHDSNISSTTTSLARNSEARTNDTNSPHNHLLTGNSSAGSMLRPFDHDALCSASRLLAFVTVVAMVTVSILVDSAMLHKCPIITNYVCPVSIIITPTDVLLHLLWLFTCTWIQRTKSTTLFLWLCESLSLEWPLTDTFLLTFTHGTPH